MVREIELTQGKIALVDDEDYERVSGLSWSAQRMRHGRDQFYARAWNPFLKKRVLMHRFILGCDHETNGQVDHENGDGLDNRKKNIRRCGVTNNLANARKRPGMTSKFKGVSFHGVTRKWQAVVQNGKDRFYLGLFLNQEDAARAYDAKAREAFGSFARLNFPEVK